MHMHLPPMADRPAPVADDFIWKYPLPSVPRVTFALNAQGARLADAIETLAALKFGSPCALCVDLIYAPEYAPSRLSPGSPPSRHALQVTLYTPASAYLRVVGDFADLGSFQAPGTRVTDEDAQAHANVLHKAINEWLTKAATHMAVCLVSKGVDPLPPR